MRAWTAPSPDSPDASEATAAVATADARPSPPRWRPSPPRWRPSPPRWRPGRWIAGAVLLLALASPALLIGREVTAPDWVRARIEQAAAQALGGGALRFGSIALRLPADLHPEVRLLDVTLADRDGRRIARVPEARVQVSPRGLLFARSLLVQEIDLVGAELSLARAADGSVEVAFGRDGSAPPQGRVRGLASLPDQFERLFERPALAALRTVRVEGLIVNYEDARAGRTWTLDGGALSLDLGGGTTRLRGDVSVLSGRSYVSRARLDYESPRGSPAARIALTLTDVAAADVASQGPALTWLRVVDAPISMALRVELDDTGALGPTSVALKIAGGELRPNPRAPGVPFEVARAYLSYDPASQSVRFNNVEVESAWGGVAGEGRAWLREIEAGLPRALLGQFALRRITAAPPGLYDAPIELPGATAQFRLRLDPFTVDVAQASLGLPGEGEARIDASGRVESLPEGWRVALDGRLPEATRDRLLALWPERLRPGLRDWIEANVTAGTFRDVAAALRIEPGAAPTVALTSAFDGATLRPLWNQPPVTGGAGRLQWEGGRFSVALERGRLRAPAGGVLDLAGTAFVVHPGGGPRPAATAHLSARGPIAAGLSVLDQPPWGFLTAAGLPVTLAEGAAEARGTIDLILGPMRPGELRFDIATALTGVRSDQLIPGHVLTADRLTARATDGGIEISGESRVGAARASGGWRQGFGPEAGGRSRVEARVEITPETLAEFGIVLPEGAVRGAGTADLTVDLIPGEAPAFAVRSDLGGLGLALPELGWSKPPGRAGALAVEGSLGSPVRVDRISLDAAGLRAEGDLRLTSGGAFDRLRLSRVRLGDWLDVPAILTARPGSDSPAIEVAGGTLDLSRATFGEGGGGGGEGGPISARLDRLQVTEGIALTDFAGEFGTEAGLEGVFSGRVNGGPAVTGRVAPQGDRVGARIEGTDAGAVMTAADIFTRAEGGTLDLLLLPEGEDGYRGELWIAGLKVVDAPVLASLLNAASVVGLLQQLGGQGIVFDEVGAEFRIDPDRVTVSQGSAIGAGLGLSATGAYDLTSERMDFEGVLSPLYILNGIGSILTRPGEGLLGVNFTLTGDADDPEVGVNPLSLLAPGALRELFRRSAPPG
ncbi:AsmA-like C-terminal region-containing protein [Rubellimicrobium aerolatum]|uniref:AsmA-like C-terminal region-containing protein n=1 Tax=Rubellimicrobium aerolatum TaxID=490979 RepID=A0ABW0SBY0_9RHOB|nr:AsmA-like C-terminal region-containing protein [Rubellimicrobium aerolatum]MBP1805970.1 hypothetical protein [Rubellimicrobium aerolatum]